MKMKRFSLITLLCLVLCISLLPVSAFADQTVVIIGGTIPQDTSAVNQGASAQAATVLAGGAGVIVSDGVSNNVVARDQNSISSAPVIVMPDGTRLAPQSAQNRQLEAAPATTATQAPTRAASAVPAGLAGQIYQRINDYRSANGLGVLGYDAQLQGTADVRAKESASSFGHTRPDGSAAVTAVTVDYTVAGENLIQVTKELASVDIIVETWLASPTHKANIVLGDFSQICPGATLSGHTIVGEHAYLASNACTVPGVKIGARAKIAAGLPVYANVGEGETLSPFGVFRS